GGLEVDLVEDLELALAQDDAALVRAAVLILEAVVGLRLVRALVVLVEDAILVVVRIGAAVLVLEAVLVLGIVRALVDDVGDAVAIVVRIGAAVLVLEVVEVLRIVRTLVDVVLDAVAVAVANRRLEDEADEDAEVGRAGHAAVERARQKAGAAADLEVRLGREVDLEREQPFERARRRRAGQPGV